MWPRLLLILTILSTGCSRHQGVSLPDGEYYGYEPMCNLSPQADPDAYWYHANVLTVHGTELHIEKAPRYLSKGKVIASASDGGFYTYEGTIELVTGKRILVRLREVSCDYCAVRVDDPLPSKKTSEYILAIESSLFFELDHVRYSSKRDPSLDWRPAPN